MYNEIMNSEEQNFITDLYQKTLVKVRSQVGRLDGIFPYSATNGCYSDKGAENIFWWTNSFWSGLLWQMFYASKDESFKQQAVANEERLDNALKQFYGLHHDVGFMWLHTSVAHFQFNKNEESFNRALHAATLLAGRFNIKGQFIRAWNKPFVGASSLGYLIIDSMMNLPLLYWASKQTGDPRFNHIANAHANTVMQQAVRSEGSVAHIVNFDAFTGQCLGAVAGQGYSPTSSWSRGQAWALYGFALSYRHSQNRLYLATAEKIAAYFIGHIEKSNFIALCDFTAPDEPIIYDSSASLCAACGLLELTAYVDRAKADYYREIAYKIVHNTSKKWANFDANSDGLIDGATTAYYDKAGHHINLIYGDYFFVEALLRLLGKNYFCWG
jgi:unsaturated chondroitin disaccharide hydrolase